MIVTAEHLEHRALWVAGLRAGLAQGRGVLCTVDGKHCCLGVAEKMANASWIARGESLIFRPDPATGRGSWQALSRETMEWLGLVRRDPWLFIPSRRTNSYDDDDWFAATTLNDHMRLTLSQIGDLVEMQADDWVGYRVD